MPYSNDFWAFFALGFTMGLALIAIALLVYFKVRITKGAEKLWLDEGPEDPIQVSRTSKKKKRLVTGDPRPDQTEGRDSIIRGLLD